MRAALAVSRKLQGRAIVDQIKRGVARKFIVELIDVGVIADRVGIIKKHVSKIRAIPGNKIDDVARSHHVQRPTAGAVDQINHGKTKTDVLVGITGARPVRRQIQNAQGCVGWNVKFQRRCWVRRISFP